MDIIGEKPIKKSSRSKQILYEKEQKEILKKIYDITGVTDTNKMIAFYDIDSNQKKIDAIMALKDDVNKYFKVCMSSYTEIKREYLSILKHVLKHMKIQYLTTKKNIHRDKVTHASTIIIIVDF
jgi:hypothetical protein